MKEKMIAGDTFVLYEPKLRWPATVTISEDDIVSLNTQMQKNMPCDDFRVWISLDGQRLLLEEQNVSGTTRKRKKVTHRGIAGHLAALGIGLPCVYEMKNDDTTEGAWIGDLNPPVISKPKPAGAAKKPRKRGLKTMLPKEAHPK